MGLLSRGTPRQTVRDRGRLRRHLRDLDEVREERLRDLGGLAVEMYKRDRFVGSLVWERAAAIAAIDDEARLVKRGLDEGLSKAELEELARE
jgi:hypothetical protein